MAVLRKIALGLLLFAAAGVLVMASWELWNYRQWVYSPLNEPGLTNGARARLLQDRMDLLTKRVGDMELLVLILLGTSGLYAIVFVASSYFSATSFARQADQTIGHIQDQIGLAMGDLRELQEETEQRLSQMTAAPAPANLTRWETQIAEITARLAGHLALDEERPLNEPARFELMHDESMAAYLEVVAYAQASSSLAGLYLGFGRIYAASDQVRSRFYLERGLRLAAPESALASEIHYQLACRYAASHDFRQAMRELAAAFEHQFKTLEERLASDIEEGGKLYGLASSPPFDKDVNDLLLNMSIGIG
jgi:hypothetical protein